MVFRRILVPLDGTRRCETILRRLEPLLRQPRTDVLLLRAVAEESGAAGLEAGKPIDERRREAEKYLIRLLRCVQGRGISARATQPRAEPSAAILETARRERPALVAMTTHGRSGLERLVLGSIAERVLRSTPVPLLLVPVAEQGPATVLPPEETEPLSFRTILVPVDGRGFSAAVFPDVARLARAFGSRVVLLYVEQPMMNPGYVFPGSSLPDSPAFLPMPSPQDIVGRSKRSFSSEGIDVETATATGEPAARILEAVRSHGADLIAMTTHGRSGVLRWIAGSVTEKVLRSSPVHLLLVRNARRRTWKRDRSADQGIVGP